MCDGRISIFVGSGLYLFSEFRYSVSEFVLGFRLNIFMLVEMCGRIMLLEISILVFLL